MNIYQKAANHLKEMICNDKPAINDSGDCMYRSPNGPCAVGFLISDEVYKKSFEGYLADEPIIVEAVAKSQGVSECSIDRMKLLDIQVVHDQWSESTISDQGVLKILSEMGY